MQTLQNTTIQLETTTVGTPRNTRRIENALLRIGQEAVTNAMRHSNATHIQVQLEFDTQGVKLRVHDDGCGFDVPDTMAATNGHYGLVSMRERAEDIEARFNVASAKGAGTDVEVIVQSTPDEDELAAED